MEKSKIEYYKYMSDFLIYFKSIINKNTIKDKEKILNELKDFNILLNRDIENSEEIEEKTNIIHFHLYNNENVNFINYWHFWRCSDLNMHFPI